MTWRFLISTVLVVTSVSASDCIVDGSSWCRCDRSDTAAVDCTAWETEALFHDTNVFPVGTTIVRLSVGSMITLRNMSSFPGLKELHLPYNDIYHIQVDAFRNVEGLLKLDLSNNGLMRLRTDTFEGLTSLTYLDLSVNALIYPEDGGWVMFGRQYLPQLRMLNLSHNALVNGVYKVTWGIMTSWHDDVIKWKHFPRYWPFVRGIHRSRWIPRTKASDAELWCFLWSASE